MTGAATWPDSGALRTLLHRGLWVLEGYPIGGSHVLGYRGAAAAERLRAPLQQLLADLGYRQVGFPLLAPVDLVERLDRAERVSDLYARAELADGAAALAATHEAIAYWWIGERLRRRDEQLPLRAFTYGAVVRARRHAPFPFSLGERSRYLEAFSVHASPQEAADEVERVTVALDRFLRERLLLPCVTVRRPQTRRSGLSQEACSVEVVLPDGRVLPLGLVYLHGDRHAEAFGLRRLEGGARAQVVHFGLTDHLLLALLVHGAVAPRIALPTAIVPAHLLADRAVTSWPGCGSTEIRTEADTIQPEWSGRRILHELSVSGAVAALVRQGPDRLRALTPDGHWQSVDEITQWALAEMSQHDAALVAWRDELLAERLCTARDAAEASELVRNGRVAIVTEPDAPRALGEVLYGQHRGRHLVGRRL